MAVEKCPRCGRTTDVEELGTTAGCVWAHCRMCGHLWREPGPGLDAFSLILASRAAAAVPIEEPTRAQVRPRAARFLVRLSVRYRTATDLDWRHGITENISRSGMLFRTDGPVPPQTVLDLVLMLPGSVAGEPTSRVRCQGQVVRTVAPDSSGIAPAVAATVGGYQLALS